MAILFIGGIVTGIPLGALLTAFFAMILKGESNEYRPKNKKSAYVHKA